jgi:NADPH-dependent glutamate synthase beta subunit-like oxidoreductase
VTVYDAADKIGGMLRLSIPEFRLPSHIVEDEVYKNEAW